MAGGAHGRSDRILLLARNRIATALAGDAILLESPRPWRVRFVPLCTCRTINF
jgi:hypothetical protein